MSTRTDAATSREKATRVEDLLRHIRGEYKEMPGLSLTLAQAQRLWSLDAATCTSVLRALVECRFLRTTARGRYILR